MVPFIFPEQRQLVSDEPSWYQPENQDYWANFKIPKNSQGINRVIAVF
jgi:hypothetical protein